MIFILHIGGSSCRVINVNQTERNYKMFLNSYGEEFELKDYMRSLGSGWEFVRMFDHPRDDFMIIVETKHPDRGTMQQGLIAA